MKYTLIFTTYFSILMIGLLGARSVQADQVVFSQFDGKNTWTNVYVNVPDARAYATRGSGVAYVAGTNGKKQIATSGIVRTVTVSTWGLTTMFTNDIPSAAVIEQLRLSNGLEGLDGTVTDITVKGKSVIIASKEEPQTAKAVVVVPADADMRFFMIYFFDDRITYLQLIDNYQQMHPLVPFTGNK